MIKTKMLKKTHFLFVFDANVDSRERVDNADIERKESLFPFLQHCFVERNPPPTLLSRLNSY